MEKKRIFIGIAFDESTIQRLVAIQDSWKKLLPSESVRWIPKENFHTTLHFIGLTEEWRVGLATRVLKEIALPQLSFTLNHMLAFPNFDRARVLGIGGQEGNSPLSNLFHKIGTKLEYIGYKLETRIFVPHVTFARTMEPTKIPERFSIQPVTIEVTAFTLFESHTLPSGSRYEALATFPLTN